MRSARALRWALLSAAVGLTRPALGGDVTGIVRFTGAATAAPPVTTTKDRAVCGSEAEDESGVVTEGRLANVVVLVKGAPAGAPAKLTLDQQRCRYRPHVQAAPVGSTLEILNSDPLLHSVHGWAGRMTRFDVVTPSKGMRVPTKLEKAGLIQIRCDVHAWMSAYVMVADAAAAVTAHDGTFTIRDVPPGSYTVTAWHERFGEKSARVVVPASGAARVDVVFGD